MKIFERADELQSFLNDCKKDNKKVSLVPTMGGLHEGHLRLVEKAQAISNIVVVSIFINPTQFSIGEDFDSYPKNFASDKALLGERDVDVLFIPSDKEIYPSETLSSYEVGEMGVILCGKSRPLHFKGVAQVVRRLFEIVKPDHAVFGEKDYQQLLIIKSLVNNLGIGTSIISVETQREVDGLAMSTRNQYLSKEEREKAPFFYSQLNQTKTELEQGGSIELIKSHAVSSLSTNFDVEYFEILSANNLTQIMTITSEVIIISAVRLGNTRLIDNIVFRRTNV